MFEITSGSKFSFSKNATFVLSKMTGERLKNVELGMEKAQKLVEDWVNGKNISTTM